MNEIRSDEFNESRRKEVKAMNRDRLVQLAYDRQAEMRQVARQNHRLAQSSQERASNLRSREHEERRQRASLQLRQAE